MDTVVYKKSLTAKLVLERGFMLDSYQAIKDLIASYNDVITKPSFYKERIVYGKTKIALIKSFKKNLVIYFSVNPNKLSKKYLITDVSNVISYKNYPSKLIIENEKDLNNAIELFVRLLKNAGALDSDDFIKIDYNKVLYERTFDELLNEGLIKTYIKKYYDIDYSVGEPNTVEKENNIDYVLVNFNVIVKGGRADKLYLLSNYNNWNIEEAEEFERFGDIFKLTKKYPRNFKLEFKVSYSKSWDGVEKGMFGEEIINHTYLLRDDMNIEDIVYNFREK